MSLGLDWRGRFTSREVNGLHAAVFETRLFDDEAWDWEELTAEHSLGWVTARRAGRLVGFVNVVWDGLVHAWLQDVMVHPSVQREGIGRGMTAEAVNGARSAGCEWLHVDFEDHLRPFYFDACGFTPTSAGLIALRSP